MASGWLTIDTWLAATSVVFAWMAFAIARSSSGLIMVYVAAFAPDAGQSTAELANSYPAPPGSAGIAKTADGFLYLPPASVSKDFAPDVKPGEQQIIAATQGPITRWRRVAIRRLCR